MIRLSGTVRVTENDKNSGEAAVISVEAYRDRKMDEYQNILYLLNSGERYKTDWIGSKKSFKEWVANDLGLHDPYELAWRYTEFGGVAEIRKA